MWLKLTIDALLHPLKMACYLLVKIYSWTISPFLPHTCRFYPTCSKYMLSAIKEWGICKGVWLGLCRICRCRPRGKCGEDFVPLNAKGEFKWTY